MRELIIANTIECALGDHEVGFNFSFVVYFCIICEPYHITKSYKNLHLLYFISLMKEIVVNAYCMGFSLFLFPNKLTAITSKMRRSDYKL